VLQAPDVTLKIFTAFKPLSVRHGRAAPRPPCLACTAIIETDSFFFFLCTW
jgi:hypothetical protein